MIVESLKVLRKVETSDPELDISELMTKLGGGGIIKNNIAKPRTGHGRIPDSLQSPNNLFQYKC